jgi:hypothetical protein
MYLEYRHKAINKNTTLNDENGNEIRMIDLLKAKKNLIFYIPKFSCSSCYEKIFQDIPKMDSMYNMENMLIISSLNDANSLNNFKRVNHILSPIYNSFENHIISNMSMDKIEKPCFIELSNDGDILSTQIVDSENFEFMFEYLARIMALPQ